MGRKHPDYYNPPPDPLRGLLVGEMYERGWIVRAKCRRCDMTLTVNLMHVIKILGPYTILWGAAAPCRAWVQEGSRQCNGVVRFQAAAVLGGSWVDLHHSRNVEDAKSLRRKPKA